LNLSIQLQELKLDFEQNAEAEESEETRKLEEDLGKMNEHIDLLEE